MESKTLRDSIVIRDFKLLILKQIFPIKGLGHNIQHHYVYHSYKYILFLFCCFVSLYALIALYSKGNVQLVHRFVLRGVPRYLQWRPLWRIQFCCRQHWGRASSGKARWYVFLHSSISPSLLFLMRFIISEQSVLTQLEHDFCLLKKQCLDW